MPSQVKCKRRLFPLNIFRAEFVPMQSELARRNSPSSTFSTNHLSLKALIPAFYICIYDCLTCVHFVRKTKVLIYGSKDLVLEQPLCHTYAKNRKQQSQVQVHPVLTGPHCILGTVLLALEHRNRTMCKHQQVCTVVLPLCWLSLFCLPFFLIIIIPSAYRQT